MPCHDGRDTYGGGFAEGMEEARHNSDVAEMLCALCKFHLGGRDEAYLLLAHKDLLNWWKEHQIRDRKKAEEESRREELRKAAAKMKEMKELAELERLSAKYGKR